MVVSSVMGACTLTLPPSSRSRRQCIMLPPTVIWRCAFSPFLTRISALAALAVSRPILVLVDIMPPLRMAFSPFTIFRRSSALKPTATGPLKGRELSARRETVTPAAVLLRAWFFTRVSRREVYTMSFPPIVWTSTAPVEMMLRRWYTLASASPLTEKLFLSFWSCAITLTGTPPRYWSRGRSMEPFSQEKPSTPSSWSTPCASTKGRTIQPPAASRKR
mmetsp:Transcript_27384/g.48783  ORF Transcript_27384/g.48783 Transcript_27384/m.48783 type:complete len:219 (-) Transcript_27384:1494-2150(-)